MLLSLLYIVINNTMFKRLFHNTRIQYEIPNVCANVN